MHPQVVKPEPPGDGLTAVGPAPNLSSFMWTDWQRLRSSNLRTTRYESELHHLEIQFLSGTTYRFDGVPSTIFQNLLVAPSPGKYFNAEIKDIYPEV